MRCAELLDDFFTYLQLERKHKLFIIDCNIFGLMELDRMGAKTMDEFELPNKLALESCCDRGKCLYVCTVHFPRQLIYAPNYMPICTYSFFVYFYFLVYTFARSHDYMPYNEKAIAFE